MKVNLTLIDKEKRIIFPVDFKEERILVENKYGFAYVRKENLDEYIDYLTEKYGVLELSMRCKKCNTYVTHNKYSNFLCNFCLKKEKND